MDHPQLLQHHIASRAFSAVSTTSGAADVFDDQKRQTLQNNIFSALRSYVESPELDSASTTGEEESVERLSAALKERHVATVIQVLLDISETASALPLAVSRWLLDSLGISSSSSDAQKVMPSSAPSSFQTVLGELIEDPVSAPVIHRLVSNRNRVKLLRALDLQVLLTTKRGNRFLCRLLTLDSVSHTNHESSRDAPPPTTQPLPPEGTAEYESAVATELLDEAVMGTRSDAFSLAELAFDASGNFVVQRIIALIAHVSDASRQRSFFERVLALLPTPTLRELIVHPVGVHVVLELINTTSKLLKPEKALGNLREALVPLSSILTLLSDKNGSLVLRRLIERGAIAGSYGRQRGSPSDPVFATLEQHFGSMMMDPQGNLIVQEMLKAMGPASASAFAKKHFAPAAIVGLAQHPSASHVLYALFDLVDGVMQTELCSLLKPHAIDLARHVNGRFIVEKLIPLRRDIREALCRHFVPLASSKGCQHLLVLLVQHLDPTMRENLINNIVIPSLKDLATHAGGGSIALQKLVQQIPQVAASARLHLKKEPQLRRDLMQNFFGKFVVQILDSEKGLIPMAKTAGVMN
jgi:hypothetical protein